MERHTDGWTDTSTGKLTDRHVERPMGTGRRAGNNVRSREWRQVFRRAASQTDRQRIKKACTQASSLANRQTAGLAD